MEDLITYNAVIFGSAPVAPVTASEAPFGPTVVASADAAGPEGTTALKRSSVIKEASSPPGPTSSFDTRPMMSSLPPVSSADSYAPNQTLSIASLAPLDTRTTNPLLTVSGPSTTQTPATVSRTTSAQSSVGHHPEGAPRTPETWSGVGSLYLAASSAFDHDQIPADVPTPTMHTAPSLPARPLRATSQENATTPTMTTRTTHDDLHDNEN